ncbi:N-substituted formamide deformylase [Pseudoalteromonas sp. CIP111854]|uniref:N-substituted formamide deformylase n=1 Tax=Pseudoalteromonas holothuriae TaxID=2963714 RepID=A0A9W4R1J2_9GAMM|nr:amidohydrolase [Pseudoalteromonas sp. CIP111854]CAH9063026.1 N-substituted formamide deformylase [Pseudoalteromonas sp. CIP111854]
MKLFVRLVLLLCSSAIYAQTTLIHNVHGYSPTQKGELTTFTTLVFKDGKVVKTGNDSIIDEFPQANKIDGKERTLLPGLIDAHGHIIGLGNNLLQLDLRGSQSVNEVGKKLQAYAAQAPKGWITGRGWDQTLWPGKQFPTARQLDEYINDRPVVLTRVDGHAVWTNSKAMALAGINKDSDTPPGGEVIRLNNGQPSGVFIDKAEQLIVTHIPPATDEQRQLALNTAGKHLLSLGITSAHDAGIEYATWHLYQQRAKQHTLPLRIYGMLSAGDSHLSEMLKHGVIKEKNDYLSIRSVKIYADGALGSRGAALLEDYHDRKGHKGLMLETQPQLETLLKQSFSHGYSAHTHAIGDKANRIVLDSYENIFNKVGGKLLRNRIEHAQIVHPNDIKRFKALSIIPSMQPIHATSDMHMAEQRLNNEQLRGAYAWQTFLTQGSKIAAGSDFPVELANPFHGLHAAVTRMSRNSQPKNGWRAQETLNREQALRAFTLDAAYAAFQEYKLGSLEQGKWADFILVDKDYFKVNAAQIADIQVLQTWLAGNLVYQR